MVIILIHQPGHCAMPLGAAPQHAFSPLNKLSEFNNFGMCVRGIINQRQACGMEVARLTAHRLGYSLGFFR